MNQLKLFWHTRCVLPDLLHRFVRREDNMWQHTEAKSAGEDQKLAWASWAFQNIFSKHYSEDPWTLWQAAWKRKLSLLHTCKILGWGRQWAVSISDCMHAKCRVIRRVWPHCHNLIIYALKKIIVQNSAQVQFLFCWEKNLNQFSLLGTFCPPGNGRSTRGSLVENDVIWRFPALLSPR